jgi:alkylation response protein AidB-like acyl-CoA dehydrogenase
MGKPIGEHQLMQAKLKRGDVATAVATTEAVRILGGHGFSREDPVGCFMREMLLESRAFLLAGVG